LAKSGDNKQSLIIETGITGSKEVITDLEAINTLVKDTKGRNVNVNVKTTGINETSVKNIKDITAQLTKLQNVSNNIEKSVKLSVDGSTIKDLQKQLDGVTANIGVEVKKSSINNALKEIRKVLSGKVINVTLTPHLDASKEKFDGKRAIDRIKQYVNSVFKDVEVDIKPKFNTNSIRASIRNLKQELNKVAGTETDTKVNTLIIANHRGNIDSPEMLSSWIDQISRFSRVAKKIPHGLINVKVNLAANIDENFRQLINGGLDLSKVKSGKLDINIHDGEGSSSGGGRRKGGKSKSSGSNDLSELDNLPSLTSGDSSKLLSAFNKYFNNNSKLQIKTLEDAIDKATGINFKSMGNNQDVHIQAALSKLAQEAQRYMYDNKLDEAKVLNDLANRLRTEYAKYNSEYANNGIYGPASKAQFNQLGLMSTSDYHKSLDSDRSAKIEEDNKRRAKYQKQLQADLEKGTSFLKNGSMDDVGTLLTHKLRDASNDDVKSRLELLKGYVDEFEKQTDADKKHIREALKEWVDGEVKNMKNILDAMQVRSEDVNKSIRNATAQQLNTANEVAGLNSLSHGESLKEKAFQRANLDGDYDEAIRHYRDKNRQRLERLDPMQGKIDDLLNERRGQSESERNSSNQRLVDLVNEKIRLMTDAKQSDFGLKDQIRYLESQLKKTGEDKGAYNSIKALLDKANKDFNDGIQATYADRVKYFDQMAKEAFNRAKTNAANGKDFTSDINDFLRYANLHTESQLANTKGQSADFSRYATSFQEMQKFGGIDPKLKGELADLEVEYKQLDKAMKAAGDTSKKLDNEFKALQDSVSKINSASGVNKLATDLEKVLNAKFSRGDSINKEIGALSQMATSLNSRGLDGEPIARLARRMKELSDEAKKVTQAEQQVTKAQTTQNQAIVNAEKELERLARELDKAYRAETAISKLNPFSKQSIDARKATQDYKNQLEVLYKLKRELGQLRSDGDVAKELLGKSGISNNKDFLGRTNNFVRNTIESLAGKYAREEGYARDRARRSSFSNSLVDYLTYSGKFLGRSAKGSGSALEASAMGLKDAFSLLKGSTSNVGKLFGAAGVAISAFVGGVALGVEAMSWIVNIFQRLYDVVSRLLQPGIELYKQVTKATYSMGAAISSNATFAGAEIDLAHGIATSANLQQRAMLDAEKSVFDFGEIMTSLSGTLPILLGRGMTLDQAYRTNLGVASVAKLTNLAPNQVLQETRDLAQGTITARSSQVANALGISSADLQGRDADEIFNFFMDKFKNYEDVLKQYAETPVGAFEQMMDRMKLVSMKFVEEIAFPFKELFNWLTDMTGTWVDSTKRKLMRVDMGDGTTEQFWRYINEDGSEAKGQGAKYTIDEAMTKLGDKLFLLKEAIDNSVVGKASTKDADVLSKFGINASDLSGKDITYRDVFKDLFGEVFEPIGETEFQFSDIMENLKKQFVDVFTYLGDALDELIAYISDAFGVDLSDTITDVSGVIKLLIDAFVLCAEIVVDVVSEIYNYCKANQVMLEQLYMVAKVAYNAFSLFGRLFRYILNGWQMVGDGVLVVINTLLEKLISSVVGENSLSRWFAGAKASAMGRIDKGFESFEYVKKGVSEDYNDILSALGLTDKKSKDAFSFIADMIENGKANFEEYKKKMKRESGKAIDPKDALGKKKPESDKDKEKREREARKAEKKAFDKYIAQLRDALERHIQELKDALDKNEAAYKQGLKNYDAYIQEKMKNELEEQVAKRDELLKEIEAIKSTGKYESEDEREKDLYNADKKLQSINKAIDKLTITQGEVTSILGESNQLLETLVGLNRSANDKKDKANSDITTKVETKEESLNTEDLLKYKDINDLDDKKSWAMQYFRESGFASDNASSMLAHTLTNSADLSGNIFGFDSETLNAYATKAGLNLSDATDMFKTNIMIATDKIKEAIPTDNDYTLDQFNAELKKLGMFVGDADLSVMNQLAQSFKPFMRQITTTTHTLANANGVVNQAINGYKEGEEWLNPMRSDIHGGIQCDSWVGDVYYEGGLRNIGNSPISKGTVIQDWMFQQAGLWHDVNSGYVPKPGDYISGRTHVGIVLPEGKVRSRDSWSSGVRTYNSIDDWDRYHHIEGYGEVGPLLSGSSGTNAIKDVVEKITRGTASTYTGNGLQAIEMKEKYLTTEFNLQAQLDKYEQTVFDSVEASSKSAEVIKKGLESQFDIFKTTGLNDKQQKRIVDKKERLMMFQIQELIGKQLKEQLEYQLSDIEALFNYDLTASASRVDYALITKNYQDIFTNMDNDIHRTINSIKEMIDKADAEGNRALGKDLRQALYKVTNKLNEFFDKAEDAVNKQYDYIESAMNNIGATNLQKEGLSKRFNIAKNRELAKVYRDKEVGLTAQYRELTERALKETKDLGKATGETLTAIADVQERLLKNRWALQQAEDLSKFKTSLEEANDVFKQALEDGLVDFMTDGVNAVLEGTKTIGEAFRELAVSILKTMQQFFAKKLIENLMNKLYPMDDDIKRITDTANWQPKDLLKNPQGEQTYKEQMDNPVLKPYMKEGYIIKNVPSDTTYGPIREPEYEAINPADALAQQLQKTSNSLGQFDSALWKFIDEANGKTIYPNEDVSQTKAETSANNLSVAMDNAATATTNNATTTAVNIATTEVNSNANTQATTTIQQKDSTERLNISATENDTDALNRHASALSNDTAPQVQTEGVDSVSGSGVDGGAGMQSPGSFKGNFLTSLMGSDFMQLAGGLFAVKTLFSGDTKEKLLSAIFIELQLMYVELIKLSSNLLTGLFGYASGGYISGPGTGTSDSIPAMLSNGEFVVKANAVKKYGTNFLNAVNDGTFATIKPRHHYASGGLVTETAREATSTVVTELGRGIGTNINNEAHFNLVMASNQEDAMKAFMRSPEGQRIYLDMARKYASTTVRF